MPKNNVEFVNSERLYSEDAHQFPVLPPEKLFPLIRLAQTGDTEEIRNEARNQVMEANLGLVQMWAKKMERYSQSHMDHLDFVQEGNLGLIRAIELFDEEQGSFSNYASWWLRQSMSRAHASQGSPIKTPIRQMEILSSINNSTAILQQELGREPTIAELADATKLSIYKIQKYQAYLRRSVWSLDFLVGEDGDEPLQEFIADTKNPSTEEIIELTNIHTRTAELIATVSLDPRETKIIAQRFGLDGGSGKTLDEIGLEYGITRERVRQLGKRALNKFRKHIREHNLHIEDFL